MYYHDRAKLVYLAHPRTASHSVADALKEIGFKKRVPGDHHARLWDEAPNPIVTRDTRSEWLVFTVVRNHFDTAVSWILRSPYVKQQPWSLDVFRTVLDASKKWFTDSRLWWLHADDADVVLRYETLEPSLNDLLVKRGLPSIELPRKNVSEHRQGRHYRDFYTTDTARYVRARFGDEMERYGYAY